MNEQIRSREVLVIDESGERLGVLPIAEALAAARERDLDLVEVAPGSVPPVCRLLEYGKYKYELAKRERAGRHQHHGELREVRFKVKIGDHDIDLKMRRAERFLREGDKVKLSVMFRGREIIHPEIGRALLERVKLHLQEVAVIEKPPTMEGRFMNMIVSPLAARPPRPPKEAAKPVATES
jgi:translation initiation factor IF-3